MAWLVLVLRGMQAFSRLALATLAVASFSRIAMAQDASPAPGYHVKTSTNWALVGPGIGLIAASGLAFVGALVANRQSAKTDTGELGGPILTMTGALLVTGGATLTIVGLMLPQRSFVRDGQATVRVVPMLGPSHCTVTASVVF